MGSVGQPTVSIAVAPLPPPGNYLPEACKGCVVVHRSHPLILGMCPVDEDEATFQWDPQSKVFTVVNAERHTCFTYLTFCGVDVLDRHDQPFAAGTTRSECGETQSVTTFVVVAEPQTAVRLGRVEVGPKSADFYAIELERLVDPPSPLGPAAMEDEELSPLFAFPLPASCGPYLCTQGVGGHLTHFFPESYHAIDLRCSCCTPVLSIGDGTVREIAEWHRCGGIHAANLAAWNAVSVLLDNGLIVEYLHTLAGSARVKVGDAVRRGQVLCETGDIGFAPEPHLHIELHDASNAEGPSLPLRFGTGHSSFVPVAGRWYSSEGEVESPAASAPDSTAENPAEVLPPPAQGPADSLLPRNIHALGAAGCCRSSPRSRHRASRLECAALRRCQHPATSACAAPLDSSGGAAPGSQQASAQEQFSVLAQRVRQCTA